MKENKKRNWFADHKKAVMAVVGVVGTGVAAGVGYAVFKKKPEIKPDLGSKFTEAFDNIKDLPKPDFKVGNLTDLFTDRSAHETVAIVDGIKLTDLGVVGEQLMAIDPLTEVADACVTIEFNYCEF